MKNWPGTFILTAFLFVISASAHADTFAVVTDSSWMYDGYNAVTSTGPFVGGGTNAVVLTGVTPVWPNPILGSQWIANVASGPGGIRPPNGFYAYSTAFNVDGLRPYIINVGIYSDDTAQVWIDDIMVIDFAAVASDTHCAGGGGGPSCSGHPWIARLNEFMLRPGTNLVRVIDEQSSGHSAGIDLSMVSIQPLDAAPEPWPLLYVGTALLAVMVFQLRR